MKKLLIWIGLICSFVLQSKAQNLACFYFVGDSTASTITICTGGTVSVKSCATLITDTVISYNPHFNLLPNDFRNTSINKPFSFTYTTPGTYKIVQDVNKGVNNRQTKTVIVLNPSAPIFRLTGCNNNIVSVWLSGQHYKQYVVDFGDASTPKNIRFKGNDTTFSYTYASTNTYNVNVTGQIPPQNCGLSAQKSITVFQSLIRPEIYQLRLSSKNIALKFHAYPYLRYKMLVKKAVGGGTYSPTDTITDANGATEWLFKAADIRNVSYCFQIETFDGCGNRLASQEICSTPVTAAAVSEQNNVSWLAYSAANFSKYTLFRNGAAIATLNGALNTQYTDKAIKCGQNYCYSVVTTLNALNSVDGSIVTAISDTQCVKAISIKQPDAVNRLQVAVADNQYVFQWKAPSGSSPKTYTIRRSSSGSKSIAQFRVSGKDSVFTEKYKGEKYCYTISYEDSCGNLSLVSAEVCPVVLTTSEDRLLNKNIYWSSYSGLPAATGYQLEWLDKDGNPYRSQTFSSSTNFFTDQNLDTLNQVLRYRIRVLLPDTSQKIYSNVGEIKQRLRIWIPEAFSPNGDGVNDQFNIYGHFITKADIQIFNQWGEIIYRTDNLQGDWDGQRSGNDVQGGVYVLRLEITDQTGNTQIFRQTLTIAR
jgi:gliding motility-associated-like protein